MLRCQVDGSWIANWEGGIGLIICQGEKLIQAVSKGVKVCCPIQAEAVAMFEARSKAGQEFGS